MWQIMFFAALLALLIMVFHITLQMNGLEALIKQLEETLKTHYGNRKST